MRATQTLAEGSWLFNEDSSDRPYLVPAGWGEIVDVSFDNWTQGRTIQTYGTNTGAEPLPFQRWRHFKEAFAPEIVRRAVTESERPVSSCLDPFGGSGTTGLACQFLGVEPVIVEVNPYLADLIEAKLQTYDSKQLVADLAAIAHQFSRARVGAGRVFRHTPKTFVEPGMNGRWIFDKPVATQIACLLSAIDSLKRRASRRLFRVILGGVLVDVSNAVVNGKGRRYRQNWSQRTRSNPSELFFAAARSAIVDAHRFHSRKTDQYQIFRGDCRRLLGKTGPVDLAVFSPPYPNSFDYTDVYNIELWTLGYLENSRANQHLRRATICSHVQISREFPEAPQESRRLTSVLKKLDSQRGDLWDRRIPEMIGGYFSDLRDVMDGVHRALKNKGCAWIVIGDSRYAGIQIPSAKILSQISEERGWTLIKNEPFRSMRVSSQQGGHHGLKETLLVLQKKSTRQS